MAQKATATLLYPEYAPDVSDLGTGVTSMVSGAVPRADGYGPFQDFSTFTQALPASCRGFFFARRSDGSINVFAGTSTRLYRLDNTTFAWVDVSKGGAAYPALTQESNWRFAQFNELVLGVQSNVPPQKYTLNAGGVFADLGGSPPQAAHVAIINRFVILTGLLSAPRRAQWSDLDAPETWTAGVGLSDFQDFPDGGSAHQVSGGDAFGVVFQDEAIRTLTYAPGSPAVFQINRISTQDTLYAQYSVITAGTRVFFLSAQGFKVIAAGGEPVPIGKERVDRFFFGDVDTSSLRLVVGAVDPTATRVYWAYKSKSGQAGLFDKVLCYDWSIGQNGRWTIIPMSGQYLGYLAKPGLTLEALDAIAPGALTVTGAANNGGGLIRLTLSGLSNGPFNIVGQNFIVVYGVGGTTEANGTWKFTVIDPTHIDLVGSAFVHAYTGGGAIGGSLDALPFSLDSVSVATVAQLAAVGPAGTLGFFIGANIEAVIETDEQDLMGDMAFIKWLRPLTDCGSALFSLGHRGTPMAAITYTAEAAINSQGQVPFVLEDRYIKARFRAPAGATWTYTRGVQPSLGPAGSQ